MTPAREKRERGEREDGESNHAHVTWLEKLATGASVVLIAFLLAVLSWDAVRTRAEPAFTVTTGAPRIIRDSYRVPVHVVNTGDEAARLVMVHVELAGTDTIFAEADLTIDWLAGRSAHDAVAYFKRPAAAHRFRAEVRGYTEP